MAKNMGEWPSEHGQITKIRLSDGCARDTVPLALERWYDFHGFGSHLGNVGCMTDCLSRYWGEPGYRRRFRNL